MLGRAYTCLDFKSVDDEKRIIEGIASTIETDRMGDVVEPKGAQFSLPLPLLWQHNSDQPIGQVLDAKVTPKGITVRAQIAKNTGVDFVDQAWKLIKAGLVRGLSIGFKSIESSRIDDTFGLHFLKWEWLELSAVTIPANAQANIETVKSFDTEHAAASGHSNPQPAGVSASRAVKAVLKDRDVKSKIADQIKSFEATRQAKAAERDEIMDTSAEAGETLDAQQSEKYDTLTAELKSIDEHLKRLREREKEQLAKAVEVVDNEERPIGNSVKFNGAVQMGRDLATEPGLALARLAICKAASFESRTRGDADVSPLQVAKTWFPHDPRVAQHLQMKTAVAGGTVSDSAWASPLAPLNTIGSDFIAFLRGKTIIDSFGVNGNPPLRSLPFNVKVPRQTSGFTGYWVGEGKAKPVSKGQFDTVTMDYTKAAAIAVITRELVRYQVANADQIVRNDLAKAVMARLDTDFVDPAKAVSSHVNPASLTNGVTSKTTAGTSAANVLTDVEKLVAPFLNNNYDPSSLVLIMPNTLCLALSLMVTTNGVRQFPNISIGGGNLAGLPVIGSYYAGSLASYGNMVVCVSADNVGKADDGVVDVSVSTEGSVEMSDAPSGDETAGTGASVVSLWQTNSIGILAERFISWAKLRTTAVTWMQDVNWGSVGSPRTT